MKYRSNKTNKKKTRSFSLPQIKLNDSPPTIPDIFRPWISKFNTFKDFLSILVDRVNIWNDHWAKKGVIFEYKTVDTWNKFLIYKLLNTVLLLNMFFLKFYQWQLSFHCCHFSYLPLICDYFSSDIDRGRAVPSLSMMQKTFHLFSSRRFQGPLWMDVLEKTHKDKNYLVRLSTHDGEEWNDEEGQRGHRER